jgi:hypothetical protein
MNQPTPEQTLNIKLTIGEYNFLHAILSDLPTRSNAWVLRNNIEMQAKAQAEAQNIPVVDPNTPAPAAE